MKNFCMLVFALCALVVTSCGDGIKQRPLRNESSQIIKRSTSSTANKSVLKDYKMKFWDAMDTQTYPIPKNDGHRFATASNTQRTMTRFHAAYRLGELLANPTEENVNTRFELAKLTVPDMASDSNRVCNGIPERVFLNCVSEAEESNEYGLAAVMVSGYYFGYLNTVVESVNPGTKLPDEKIVARGIQNLDSLRTYLNEALSSEEDVNAAFLLQKIQKASFSIDSLYKHMSTENDADKYNSLSAEIKAIDNCF